MVALGLTCGVCDDCVGCKIIKKWASGLHRTGTKDTLLNSLLAVSSLNSVNSLFYFPGGGGGIILSYLNLI